MRAAGSRRPFRVCVLDVNIEALRFRGEGLSEPVDGRRWRVPKALPGERVAIELVDDARGRPRAVLTRVLSSSPARRAVDCPHDHRCPGCQLLAFTPTARRAQRREAWREALARLAALDPAKVEEVTPARHEEGYRTRARARLFRVGGSLHLGMTPLPGCGERPVSLSACPAQSPRTRALLTTVIEALALRALQPLDLASGEGLAEVWVDEGAGDRARITLVSARPACDEMRALASGVHAVDANVSIDHGVMSLRDTGLPLRDLQRLAGEPGRLLVERDPYPWEASPGAWVSATPAHAVLVRAILMDAISTRCEGLPLREILEIGCGIGTHTLPLARYAEHITGVDSSRAAIQDAEHNVERSGLPPERFNLRVGRAARVIRRLLGDRYRADLVILHGMRRPYGERVCRALAPLGAAHVAIITPSVFALGEDLKMLHQVGYETAWVQPIDTMPGTYHMMAVAWLRLASKV